MQQQYYSKPKTEFSKKILIVSYVIAILITVFTCMLAFMQKDISSFSTIVLACWGEVTVGNGFYYWKARGENKIKIMQSIPKNLQDRVEFNFDKEN